MRYHLMACLLFSAMCGFGFAETLEEKLKATDMSNADAVFELSQWCAQNNLPSKSRTYLNQVIKLDKDHEGARTALGQIKVGERWVAAPADQAKKPEGGGSGDPAAPSRQASGAPPTADQIVWDLTLPKDPKPQNTWINQYFDRMNNSGNDSNEMSTAVATMLQAEQIDLVVPRMCRKLLDPAFGDLYGCSDIISELMRSGNAAKARVLLPFLMKASERSSDPGDLAAFAYSVGQFKDKRVVPRLLQLLDSANPEIKEGAASGLQMVTLLPLTDITPDRMKQWWSLNHNVSDQQIYLEQLRSSDPRIALGAAQALYEFRERSIVPALAKLMRGEDKVAGREAAALVKRICGNDWSYNAEDPADKRKKRADDLEKWWKDEQFRFIWIEDSAKAAADSAKGPVAATDPAVEWVKKLGSAIAADSTTAESNLAGGGNKVVPALIGGLDDNNRLVRRKCQELLERITKQKIPYDPAAEQAARAPQVAAWRDWAVQQKLMGVEESEEPADATEKPPTQAPGHEKVPAPAKGQKPEVP